jgi:hypothetical protein
MNNLMLTFSGADLSRLRTLVAAVDKDIALLPHPATPAGNPGTSSALDTTWSRLVTMLDLGNEPKMRECPACKSSCMLGATLCSHCWASLPKVGSKEQTAA